MVSDSNLRRRHGLGTQGHRPHAIRSYYSAKASANNGGVVGMGIHSVGNVIDQVSAWAVDRRKGVDGSVFSAFRRIYYNESGIT